MIEHKCLFKAFDKTAIVIIFLENIRRKIISTPFDHFLDFARCLAVDSSLLDDCCCRYESSTTFSFGSCPVRRLEMIGDEVGNFFSIPWKGRKIDLKVGNYHTTFYKQHLRTYVMSWRVFGLLKFYSVLQYYN